MALKSIIPMQVGIQTHVQILTGGLFEACLVFHKNLAQNIWQK